MKYLIKLYNRIMPKPLKIAGYTYAIFGALFTLSEALNFFLDIKIEGPITLTGILIISLGLSLKMAWKPSKIEIHIAHSNTVIEVLFGDLFEQSGLRVIPMNEFFDTTIGKPVSEKSLHGILIQKIFGGYSDALDKQLNEQLKKIESHGVEKIEGKNQSFPIGTTALIHANQNQYLLFALTKTHPKTLKAYCDVGMMWLALDKLWQRGRIEAGGHELNLPLIGSGLSGVGLPIHDLLNMIILSIITATKSKEITHRIRILLLRERFQNLDLRKIKKYHEEK